MKIPFTKAHGAHNDFLLTWRRDAPPSGYPAIARAICDRHTGIGADGWMLVDALEEEGAQGAIELYNSDGSAPEISGNGTRCAAAFLIHHGRAADAIRIRTGAGVKTVRLLSRAGLEFAFEMDMGRVTVLAERFRLPLESGPRDATLIDAGNPQCAVPVTDFNFDWRTVGAQIERHPHFPNRTNVSFVKAADAHSIDVRFWERGAGETMSSGTGSAGAAVAAAALGLAQSPVRVLTPAGPLEVRIEEDRVFLAGPAALVGEGFFFSV